MNAYNFSSWFGGNMEERSLWQLTCLFLVLVSLLSSVSEAATCNCKQHKAEASANDTCSLSESSTFCSISFGGASKSTQEEFENLVQKMDLSKEIKIGPGEAFEQYWKALVSGQEVSEEAIIAMALASVPLEQADNLRSKFLDLFKPGSGALRNFIRDLTDKRCARAYSGDFSVMIKAGPADQDC